MPRAAGSSRSDATRPARARIGSRSSPSTKVPEHVPPAAATSTCAAPFFHLAWPLSPKREVWTMATLTMIDGEEIKFSPSRVSALMDYDAVTHAAVTSVFGLRKGIVFTKERVADFMDRVGITKKFARLTKPDGHVLWVNGDAVVALSLPSSSGLYVKEVR